MWYKRTGPALRTNNLMKTIVLAVLTCAACHAQAVTIVNSGSTNTAGFQITVDPSGKAEYTQRPRVRVIDKTQTPPPATTVNKTIPKRLANSLYADVHAARPLSSLPGRFCAKSTSFGTRLTLEFGDETSPDLSCGDGGNAMLKALIRDVDAVVKLFRGN